MASEIWLIRHGESAWNVTGQHTGQTDIELSPEGERQAISLGEQLGGRIFGLVLVSPMKRAMATCRLAGYLDQAEPVRDLVERSYGDFEGLTWPEIRAIAPEWSIWGPAAPNGESVEHVAQRARRVLDRIARVEGAVALFAHGHLLRVLAACWLELTPDHGRLFSMATATISVLGRENGRPVIRRWGIPPDLRATGSGQ